MAGLVLRTNFAMPPKRLVICTVLAMIPGGFAAYGVQWVADQHRAIRTYQPTQGTVLSSVVVSEYHPARRNADGKWTKAHTTYDVEVDYAYYVAGRRYTSGRVGAAVEPHGKDDCREVVRTFPAGVETTVYYDPADPSRAFLLRRYSATAYILIVVMLPFAATLLAVGLNAIDMTPGPKTTPVDRVVGSAVAVLVWVVGGAVAVVDYGRHVDDPFNAIGVAALVLYFLLGSYFVLLLGVGAYELARNPDGGRRWRMTWATMADWRRPRPAAADDATSSGR